MLFIVEYTSGQWRRVLYDSRLLTILHVSVVSFMHTALVFRRFFSCDCNRSLTEPMCLVSVCLPIQAAKNHELTLNRTDHDASVKEMGKRRAAAATASRVANEEIRGIDVCLSARFCCYVC